MKTSVWILLGAVLLTACHHHDSKNEIRRGTPTYRRSDDTRREYRRSPRRTPEDTPYRSHRRPGYVSPLGMYWNCPTEPQTLGYVTR